MPRFSLRDLFWLTLVVGMALGWWVRERRLAGEASRAQAEHWVTIMQTRSELATQECALDSIEKQLSKQGIDVTYHGMSGPFVWFPESFLRQDSDF